MIAAVCKLMSNMDLIVGAKKSILKKPPTQRLAVPELFQIVYSRTIQPIMSMALWLQLWKVFLMAPVMR